MVNISRFSNSFLSLPLKDSIYPFFQGLPGSINSVFTLTLFRADAAFAKPEVYLYLEGHSFLYAIRLPANDLLEQEIKHLLKRPEGELPEKLVIRYHDFQYQAKSWVHPR